MGTQTMTEKHAGRTFNGWGDKGTEQTVDVVVKRSGGVGVSMHYGNGQGCSIRMTEENAMRMAQAIISAVTGVDCYEDAFTFTDPEAPKQ